MSRARVTRAVAKKRPVVVVSERERRFVEHFMSSGNATKAAILAGYSRKTARKQGSRLLTKGNVRAAIDQAAKSDPAVWTREDRQRFWTAVASGALGYAKAALKDRLRASELLGKSQADFVERHEVDAGASLVELLADLAARNISDVPRRLAALQAGRVDPIWVMRVVPGALDAERWYQQRFAAQQLVREWFAFHKDMLTVTAPNRVADALPPRLRNPAERKFRREIHSSIAELAEHAVIAKELPWRLA